MCSIFHLPDTFPILKSHVRGFFAVTFNKNGVGFYLKKTEKFFQKNDRRCKIYQFYIKNYSLITDTIEAEHIQKGCANMK